MSALVWSEHPDQPLVWYGENGEGHKALIVGGVQRYEGKKVLEIETFGCAVDGVEIGQRGSVAYAKEWCQTYVDNLPPVIPFIVVDMHLWRVVQSGPHRRIEGCVYGQSGLDAGTKITTDIVVELVWDADGDLATIADKSVYRLCREEHSARLIAAGYLWERAEADVVRAEQGE
jgi:hypothetical protein